MTYAFKKLAAEDGGTVRGWLEAVRPWVCIDDWDAYYVWAQQNPDYCLFKAMAEDEMLAMFGLETEKDRGFICIVVNPMRQGRGYGKLLLAQFLREAKQLTGKDIRKIVADIFPGNKGSIRCFTGCGFKYCGTREDGDKRYEFLL